MKEDIFVIPGEADHHVQVEKILLHQGRLKVFVETGPDHVCRARVVARAGQTMQRIADIVRQYFPEAQPEGDAQGEESTLVGNIVDNSDN